MTIHIHISDISSAHPVVLCITTHKCYFATAVILSIQLVIAQLLTPRTVGKLQFACNRLTLVASFITLTSTDVPLFFLTDFRSTFVGFIFQRLRGRPTSLVSWCITIQSGRTTIHVFFLLILYVHCLCFLRNKSLSFLPSFLCWHFYGFHSFSIFIFVTIADLVTCLITLQLPLTSSNIPKIIYTICPRVLLSPFGN